VGERASHRVRGIVDDVTGCEADVVQEALDLECNQHLVFDDERVSAWLNVDHCRTDTVTDGYNLSIVTV
jgi:hypothetical protein